MILSCVKKKAFFYRCPFIIPVAIVVHYQMYAVVMITMCANQKKKHCLDLEYSVTSLVTSLKCMVHMAMTTGNPQFKSPPKIDQ